MSGVTFATGAPDVFVAGLLGAVDVDGGPTDEQLAVLRAFVTHVWQRPDLDLATLTPLRPERARGPPAGDEARLRFCEMVMVLELCRHPQSAAQVAVRRGSARPRSASRASRWRRPATALEQGAAVVAADLERLYGEILPEVSERSAPRPLPDARPARSHLADRLRALADLPPGRSATPTSRSTSATASRSPATTSTSPRTT